MAEGSSTTFRLMTFNIHGWEDEKYRCNFDRVVDCVRTWKPDVLGLNEVTRCRTQHPGHPNCVIEAFAEKLTFFKDWTHGDSGDGYLGNALLSSSKFSSKETLPLQELRCAIFGELADIVVVVTHLDHMSEELRLLQAGKLLERCKQLKKPHILMGDFNSLTRSDYDDDEWEDLIEERKSRRWELPEHKVTKLLTKSGYRDAWTVAGRPEKRFTAHVRSPKYGIDYFWLSSKWKGKVKNCQIVQNNASDHFPLILDIEM
ncbi:uncharacterized protein [Oscarella lobularis]|uniref:uncharacterized protein n=1 Tax=Oscarella lobularis TaxID=121494 RepID=UPI0033133D9B